MQATKFGFLVAIFFTFFVFIFRMALPFGDEPDFSVRAPEVLEALDSNWSPYYWFYQKDDFLNITKVCEIKSSPTSLWAYIDYTTCGEEGVQKLWRATVTTCLLLPFLFLIVFRRFGVSVVRLFDRCSYSEANLRITSIGVSILFPGYLYYIGLLSQEQFVLFLALWIFLFIENWKIIIPVLIFSSTIDFGNTVVITTFLLLSTVSRIFSNKMGAKKVVYIHLMLVATAFFFSSDLLSLLKAAPFLTEKVNAIQDKHSLDNFFDSYPLILRPVMTFLSATFITPAGLKFYPLYIIYVGAFAALSRKLFILYQGRVKKSDLNTSYSYSNSIENSFIFVSSAITLILCLNFTLPDYSNAKYYIFLTPFFVKLALHVFRKEDIVKLFIISDLLVPISLFIYSIDFS